MANSDIKLQGPWLVVEGDYFRCRTLDLMLDAPSRRSNNSGHRRALVHDAQDGLTINYASDYPGGVTVNGEVKLERTLRMRQNVAAFKAWDLELDGGEARRKGDTKPQRRALVHGFSDELAINWTGDYTGGVAVHSDTTVKGQLHAKEGLYVDNGLWVKLEEREEADLAPSAASKQAQPAPTPAPKPADLASRIKDVRISPSVLVGRVDLGKLNPVVVEKLDTRINALRGLLDELNVDIGDVAGERLGRVNLIELVATLAERVQTLTERVEQLEKKG